MRICNLRNVIHGQQGLTYIELAVAMFLILILGIGGAEILSGTMRTKVSQEAAEDIASLKSEMYGYLSNPVTCNRIFGMEGNVATFTFNTLTETGHAVGDPGKGFVELNTNITQGSATYSPHFTIGMIELRFQTMNQQATTATGRVHVELQRDDNIIGAKQTVFDIPLSFDLQGRDIVRCRANIVSDDVTCTNLSGEWRTPAETTTGVAFCDFCPARGANRPGPPYDPAVDCPLPAPSPVGSPVPLWEVCSMNTGPGGPDCTTFVGQECISGSTMNCSFTSSYGNVPARLGCDTCPPPSNCGADVKGTCNIPGLNHLTAGGSCAVGYVNGFCSYTCVDATLIYNANTCAPPAGCQDQTFGYCLASASGNGALSGNCVGGSAGSCQYRCDNGSWTETLPNTCVMAGRPCQATTLNSCALPLTADTGTAGTCAAPSAGNCSYRCADSVWLANGPNTCTPPPPTPPPDIPITAIWVSNNVSCPVGYVATGVHDNNTNHFLWKEDGGSNSQLCLSGITAATWAVNGFCPAGYKASWLSSNDSWCGIHEAGHGAGMTLCMQGLVDATWVVEGGPYLCPDSWYSGGGANPILGDRDARKGGSWGASCNDSSNSGRPYKNWCLYTGSTSYRFVAAPGGTGIHGPCSNIIESRVIGEYCNHPGFTRQCTSGPYLYTTITCQ